MDDKVAQMTGRSQAERHRSTEMDAQTAGQAISAFRLPRQIRSGRAMMAEGARQRFARSQRDGYRRR